MIIGPRASTPAHVVVSTMTRAWRPSGAC